MKRKAHRIVQSYFCATGCGNSSTGNLFDKTHVICSACFDLFVSFCGVGDKSILLKVTWEQAFDKFLEKIKSGEHIPREYARQDPIQNTPAPYVRGVRGRARNCRGFIHGRYQRIQRKVESNKESQMSESGEEGF